MTKKTAKKWYARGGGIAKMGPFESYEKAASHCINTKGLPVEGAFVWAETAAQTRENDKLAEAAGKASSPLAPLYDALADECNRRGMKMPRKAG